MKRWLIRILAIVGGLAGASVFAKRRKQAAWENEPRSEAEWPPLAMNKATADEAPAAGSSWVEANEDGSCPEGYPVKANDRSMIFHVEGGFAYARTKPNRCYSSPEAAVADGYRASKS